MAGSGLKCTWTGEFLRSVYAAQRGNLEKTSWLEGQKTITFGAWSLVGIVRGWEGMEIGKGFLTFCKPPSPAPFCSNRRPCQWPWCLVLPCVLFWGFLSNPGLAGDFRAGEGFGQAGARFK